MSDRVVYIGNAEDVLNYALRHNGSIKCAGSDYVISNFDESAYGGLIWKEIRYLERQARLTPIQVLCFEMSLINMTTAEISRRTGRSFNAIKKHLGLATKKIDKIENKGLFTVIYEEFKSWDNIREVFFRDQNRRQKRFRGCNFDVYER